MSTYEGMGLCDKDEYRAAFETRLQYHQLMKGELYVATFDIKEHEKAYRIVGRVGILASNWGGVGKLEFQLLDDHLHTLTKLHPSATMRDGALNMDVGITYPDANKGSMRMYDGYLGHYEDDQSEAWMKELTGV
jgi:hypothetical protein